MTTVPWWLAMSVLLSLARLLAGPTVAAAQEGCPGASAPDAEAGWASYSAGELAEARRLFEVALARCEGDAYARTGLGYVELREGDDAAARRLFDEVVADQAGNVDALVGLGLLAWRADELERVRTLFARVVEVDPENATALDYLARVEEWILGPPPERPAFERPADLQYPARAAGDHFEVRTDDGWVPFYVKGVNLGAALPGRHPSEFPDSATYARWIRGMAGMHANVVRVYTIHPPAFYDALLDWNTRNPERALRLIHGVWTELPPHDDYAAPAFERAFFAEMHRVVDLLHGRADIEPRPGHAFGHYTSDVSRWTLAYIIGREWEPFSVAAFDSIRGGAPGFDGRYLTVSGGNAMDAWMGRATEEIVAYETEVYNAQRPVAYTNWPTLDPLVHPTEPTVDEEMTIRRSLGEKPTVRIREYDNDGIALDPARVRPTERLPAGYFASYHAYPYYPDFMVLDEAYARAESARGPSSYLGYLLALKQHHAGVPVLISEYGVPASLGTAHLQPQGRHHGGLSEADMAEIDRTMTLELAEAGMAGGVLFAWIDEWFKKNWVTLEFELPPDRNRLWYNRLDAEQHYGLWALEAEPPLDGRTLDERLPAWRRVPPLYGEEGLTLRAAHDAAYLWLLIEAPDATPRDTVLVGFDVIDPTRGDFSWPEQAGAPLPVGLEFVLVATGGEVRVLADPPSNPFRHVPVGQGARNPTGRVMEVGASPPGLFHARVEQRFNLPYYTEANDDGRYDSLRVVVNRRRFARDSTEYLATGYDRGVLREGPAPDGVWERASGGVLEVRVPWLLINVTDPSSRTVLQGPGSANARGAEPGPDGRWRLRPGVAAWPDTVSGALGTERIDGVGVVASVRRGDRGATVAPGPGRRVARFTWPTWEVPRWTERARPAYGVMSETYAQLDPYGASASTEPPLGAVEQDQVDPAHQAWIDGDTERAFELYTQLLAEEPRDGVALHRLALLQAWRGDYDASLGLFDRLLAVEADNLDARVDRARVQAWAGRTAKAIEGLDAVLAQVPEHLGALEARALFQAWAGRYAESISAYDQVLAISPDNAEVRRQQARVLGWASDYQASRRAYEELLARDPSDVEAALGLASTLAFSDDLTGALRAYDRILAADPNDPRALRGKGRVLGWANRLVEAEEVLRGALTAAPADVETRVVLGQILQWQGRTAEAEEVLERAVELSPTNSDARQQLAAVRVALAPTTRPTTVYERDSDGNRMLTTSLRAAFHPVPRLELRLDGYRRGLEQGALQRVALGATVTAAFQMTPGWVLSGGAGWNRTNGTGTPSSAVLTAGVRSPERHRVVLGLALGTRGLDETAALAERGVRYRNIAASARFMPTPGWRMDGALGRSVFGGSQDNVRHSGSLSVSKRLGPLSLGSGLRVFGYDMDLDDGYFDPDFYGIVEATSAWRHRPLPWSFVLEAAPGLQQVTRDGDPAFAFRGSARVGYFVAPGRELALSYAYSSAGLLSLSSGAGDAGYDYSALTLALDWVF